MPTEPQSRTLRVLAGGSAIISGLHGRPMRQCLKHGWIAPELPDKDNGFRITADGLLALAGWLAANPWPPLFSQGLAREEPRQVVQLREARDDARRERDKAQRDLHYAETTVRQVRRLVEAREHE